jgi:peptide/nickel transport system substrate-binding protein
MYEFVGFNFNNVHLKNRAFREAAALCVDPSTTVAAAYLGSAVIANAPIHPNSWLLDPETTVYPFDMALAENVLTDGGFTKTAGRVCGKNENGEIEALKLRLLVNEENNERVKAALSLKKNLGNLGIEVSVESVSFADYRERLKNKDFDMFIGGFNLGMCPYLDFAFHSSQIDFGSNYFSYADPTLDALLMDVYAADKTTLNAAITAVQRRIVSELPVISLAFRKSLYLTGARVHGEFKPMLNNVFANVCEWFIVSDVYE